MNTNIPQLLSAVRLCDPCRAHKQPVWIAISAPCFCVFDCCFIQQFHSTTPLARLTRNPEKSLVSTLCDFVTLLCHFGFFSVIILRCSPASSLDLPIMLGTHFAFSLLSMTMILTPIKYLHDQSSDVDICRNCLRQWIPVNTTIRNVTKTMAKLLLMILWMTLDSH